MIFYKQERVIHTGFKLSVKKIFLLVLIIVSHAGLSQNAFFNDADAFFKTYVLNGKVNYELLKENPASLQNLEKQISEFSLSDEAGNRNKAFYINAYNILVIKKVIDNYPVKSPKDVPGFFETQKFNVALSQFTLNQIENEILRPVYDDPRLHFVLVCGAVGCPPITNFAYVEEKLESQLDIQTRLAMNDPDFIRVNDGSVSVSEIFHWYENDFTTHSGSVLNYINAYREDKIPGTLDQTFYSYDWSLNDIANAENSSDNVIERDASNIFTYTPSRLLKKGQVEMQLFNNLYTQTAYRDGNRKKIDQNGRSTYYSALFYLLHGITKSGRLNVGFDLNVKSVHIDSTAGNPVEVFQFETNPVSRTALTSLGPKIKFQPFNNVSNFSIQSAFWIPVAKDLEAIKGYLEYPWMDYDMFTWWNQFFFDRSFGSQWQVFTEADLLFRFKKKTSNTPTHMDIPLSFFLSWFPSRKATVYYMIQYSPRFQLETSKGYDSESQSEITINPFDLVSDYAQTGLGAKYQLTQRFNLEASYTYFFTSLNGGAGSTYNLGIRIIL